MGYDLDKHREKISLIDWQFFYYYEIGKHVYIFNVSVQILVVTSFFLNSIEKTGLIIGLSNNCAAEQIYI